ncbi:hypothetical protein CARUB_v10003865mg [Capsella rubella]|uniref:Receptor-like serine/threonine-protein kinase n=1 Tax=Capsella rubella TaxID=81985 RepID=R0HH21_9BRAS|nr:hypothetical protein CARUB_v10003865mg [Capsella rubella]
METCKKNVLLKYLGVLIMFLFFQVSSATDTISTNQPLLGLQTTLISSGEIFELGLFERTTGIDRFWYIGMWYKRVPLPLRTIVWVANRDTGQTIWSTGVIASRSKDVEAVLHDNGNLVLRDGSNSSAPVLWQSFDHPSDTWFPGAKLNTGSQLLTSWKGLNDPSPGRYSLQLDPRTHSLITVWNGSKSYSSSGAWDALSFKLTPDKSYITYARLGPPDDNTYRLVIDVSGMFMLQYWDDLIQSWVLTWSQPNDRCAVYSLCGSFGICNDSEELPPCRCVPGFRPAFSNGSNDFSDGCERETKIQCGDGNDEFLRIENMKLATDPTATLVMSPSLNTTCASACRVDCSCEAYAYDGNKCLMWTRYAFNLQQYHENKGHTFFLRLAASNNANATSNQEHSKGRSIVLPVVLSSLAAAAAVFSVCFYCCVSSRRRRKRTQRDEKQSKELLKGGIVDDDGEHISYLNLHDIMVATNAFSEENKLGEGGFGPVYKGKLRNGMDVAIKRLSKKSSQGMKEFKNEVVLIIKLQHKNLVRLLGYCVESEEKLLVYEYMSNKSLDVLLFDSLKSRELDWDMRMKIVNGTTRGLQYLHEDSRLRIIHRDLKASNILLDDDMNPKISDFGTARIFGVKQIDDSTQRIVGTFGYMSPEYALGGVISEKSDIYSFGVLLLEIVSGKKATRFVHNDQKLSLIAYAWESWCEAKGVSIIDEALCGSYDLKEVMRCVHIALLCVQDHPKDRPTISQIVYMLSNDNNLPIPKQPSYSNVLAGDQQLVASSGYLFSINEVTQTEMEPR